LQPRRTPFTPDSPRALETILDFILAGESQVLAPDDPLIRELESALDNASGELLEAVRTRLSNREFRIGLSGILPHSAWTRLLRFLAPAEYVALLEIAGILASAWKIVVPNTRFADIGKMLRTATMEVLAEGPASAEALTLKILERLALTSASNPPLTATFLSRATRVAEDRGLASLRKSFDALAPQSKRTPPVRRKASANSAPTPPETGSPIYIANAGLVLASPFLPHLFSTLGMLEKDDSLRDRWRENDSKSRAVHLLQYLVDERTSGPEPLLVLNKILCGMHPTEPVEKAIEPTAEERDTCDRMLRAILTNWKVLANSSPAALRETFFQRAGKLEFEPGRWKLRVQRKTLDILLDQVPWGFGVILHSWMPEPLHVTW
jgi:hypothetical protein